MEPTKWLTKIIGNVVSKNIKLNVSHCDDNFYRITMYDK